MLLFVDRCGAKSAVFDVWFAMPVDLLRVSVVDSNGVSNCSLNTAGNASPQCLCVLSVRSGMQLC